MHGTAGREVKYTLALSAARKLFSTQCAVDGAPASLAFPFHSSTMLLPMLSPMLLMEHNPTDNHARPTVPSMNSDVAFDAYNTVDSFHLYEVGACGYLNRPM